MTTAAVVVTTRNRRDELRTALGSALRQSIPIELVVVDDGSDDGTSDMVRTEFPTAILVRREQSGGYIAARNLAATVCSAEIIFSIDDDAAFSTSFCIAQTLAEFGHPRVGAVAIPFINVGQDNSIHQQAPTRDAVYVSAAYIGTAHAVRRDLFLQVGGYREHFVHQGEEGDFCLRMLDAGYVVRLGSADPIHHFESPRRDFRRMDYYGRRNDLLFCWHNVPLPELLAHLPATAVNGLRSAAQVGRFRHMLSGIAAGLGHGFQHRKDRRPVSRRVYWLFRRLKKNGPLPFCVVDELFASWNLEPAAPLRSVPN